MNLLFFLALLSTAVGASISNEEGLADELASVLLQDVPDEDESGRSFLRATRPRQLTERCGNRNACAEGLSCRKVGVSKRCFPFECMESIATEYQDMVLDRVDKALSTQGLTRNQVKIAASEASSLQSFREGGIMDTVTEAFKANKPDDMRTIIDQFNLCAKSGARNGTTIAYGLQVEGGGGLDIGFTTYWAQGPLDEEVAIFLQPCGGLSLGLGGEVVGVFDFIFTDTNENMPGGGFQFDADAGLVLHFGAAVGIRLNCVWDIALSVGLGIGLEAFGASYCQTLTTY